MRPIYEVIERRRLSGCLALQGLEHILSAFDYQISWLKLNNGSDVMIMCNVKLSIHPSSSAYPGSGSW